MTRMSDRHGPGVTMWPMWLIRLLNRWGWRRDTMLCQRQDETWRWGDYLGAKTPGTCAQCAAPIFYEAQNAPFRKICNHCGGVPGIRVPPNFPVPNEANPVSRRQTQDRGGVANGQGENATTNQEYL